MAKEILEMEVKSNIGEVAEGVDKASTATKELSKNTKDAGESAKKASKGFGTLVKSLGIIGLLASAFTALKEAMGKNQKVIDILNTAMTSVSIVFNDFFKLIEGNIGTIIGHFKDLFENPVEKIKELGIAITEGLVDRFMELLDVVGLVGKSLVQLVIGDFSGALDTIKQAGRETVDVFTGVDESLESVVETITAYTKETIKQADAITQTAKAADRAAVQFAMLNAQFLKDAELQRQIRDDETKTFEERIEANNKLNDILAEQQELQREQVQIGITAAQQQYDINASEENFIALQESKVAMLELEETITGQLSEQKTNQVSLEKELLETQNQLRAEGLAGMERELEELQTAYDLKLEMARKAGVDTTAITAQYEKEVTKIKKTEAEKQESFEKAKKDMQLDMANQGLQILGDAAGEGTAIAKAAAIAQATISGVQGVQNAFTAANANIGATAGSFGAYPVTMAALAGTFAAMNIAKIASSGSGGGGGSSIPSAPTASAQTPAPQMMSGSFDLTGGQAVEPTRAYVVSDDITSSQDGLAIIRRRATI
tara:strand:- start:48 stop:1685 length:1638 start_codon:yes stop_codon:yes gene_type:complete